MRVSEYELFRVPPRWLFLRLETADGLVGWGEHVTGAGGVETVSAAVDAMVRRYVLDRDPLEIEDRWQEMYRGGFYRGGPVLLSAIAGIDQALWDLKGKRFGAPIYELLGGPTRDRVRVYQWIGGDEPSAVREAAREKVDAGFTALKMNVTGRLRRIDTPEAVDAARKRLETVRDEVGADVDVAVDFHGRASKTMAKRLVGALEPYEPLFVEEPVLPEHDHALPEIAHATSIPIATGERLFTRGDFRPVLETGAVDVIQPDLSHAGGITEVRKIAAMAEAYDVALAPHCPLGPIALAACLQVDGCAHNALVQEQSLDIHYNRDADLLDYLADPSVFAYEDGYVTLPSGAGLGIELDEEQVRERAREDDEAREETTYFQRPTWRHDDGSVAEW